MSFYNYFWMCIVYTITPKFNKWLWSIVAYWFRIVIFYYILTGSFWVLCQGWERPLNQEAGHSAWLIFYLCFHLCLINLFHFLCTIKYKALCVTFLRDKGINQSTNVWFVDWLLLVSSRIKNNNLADCSKNIACIQMISYCPFKSEFLEMYQPNTPFSVLAN